MGGPAEQTGVEQVPPLISTASHSTTVHHLPWTAASLQVTFIPSNIIRPQPQPNLN